MNKKQMIVLWVVALLISMGIVVKALDTSDFMLGIGGPAVILGGLLVYQFRDRTKLPQEIGTKHLLCIMMGLVLLQTLATWSSQRELKELKSTMEEIQSNVSSMQRDVSSIQSDVSSIETNTSNIGR